MLGTSDDLDALVAARPTTARVHHFLAETSKHAFATAALGR